MKSPQCRKGKKTKRPNFETDFFKLKFMDKFLVLIVEIWDIFQN